MSPIVVVPGVVVVVGVGVVVVVVVVGDCNRS